MHERKNKPMGRILLLLIGLAVIGYLITSGLYHNRMTHPPGENLFLLSFDDFNNLIGGRDRLSSAQQRALFSQYRGRYVRWSGEIYEIETKASGDFLLKVRHKVETNDYDVVVRLSRANRVKVARMNRGEAINYKGKLVSFDPETGYYLEDGDIE